MFLPLTFCKATICNENSKGYISAGESPTQLISVAITHVYTCKDAEHDCCINPVTYRDPQEYEHINLCIAMVCILWQRAHALTSWAKKSMRDF